MTGERVARKGSAERGALNGTQCLPLFIRLRCCLHDVTPPDLSLTHTTPLFARHRSHLEELSLEAGVRTGAVL